MSSWTRANFALGEKALITQRTARSAVQGFEVGLPQPISLGNAPLSGTMHVVVTLQSARMDNRVNLW